LEPKILVIRGGAIGDFVLTLPAIRLLREAFPAARLEILGYQHIVSLAVSGGYADAVRSIEYAPMAGFFNPKAELDAELSAYFASFQHVVSYLYDPDGFFSGNLRRCGIKHLTEISPKIDIEGDHAAQQLARPLERLALFLEDGGAAPWQPGEAERAFADEFLNAAPAGRPLAAIHPGSGGERKNWPLERWVELTRHLTALPETERPCLLVIGGEADEPALAAFRAAHPAGNKGSSPEAMPFLMAENLPLPQLGAILARCRFFMGHDSGISHLAAAAGVPCTLLFGPTDPDIWAPPHRSVQVLRAADGLMENLTLPEVRDTVIARLRETAQ
jgi:heptosyltransferase-3